MCAHNAVTLKQQPCTFAAVVGSGCCVWSVTYQVARVAMQARSGPGVCAEVVLRRTTYAWRPAGSMDTACKLVRQGVLLTSGQGGGRGRVDTLAQAVADVVMRL